MGRVCKGLLALLVDGIVFSHQLHILLAGLEQSQWNTQPSIYTIVVRGQGTHTPHYTRTSPNQWIFTNLTSSEESWTEDIGVSVSVSSGFFASEKPPRALSILIRKPNLILHHTPRATRSLRVEVWKLIRGCYTIVHLLCYTGHFEVSCTVEITLIGVSGSELF